MYDCLFSPGPDTPCRFLMPALDPSADSVLCNINDGATCSMGADHHTLPLAKALQGQPQSSGMGRTAWCRMAKLVLCLERVPVEPVVLLCPALLRWHSRRKSASMCVSLSTMS